MKKMDIHRWKDNKLNEMLMEKFGYKKKKDPELLKEAHDTGLSDKPTEHELKKRKELCAEKEGYEWVMPKKGDYSTVPWGSCKKKKDK